MNFLKNIFKNIKKSLSKKFAGASIALFISFYYIAKALKKNQVTAVKLSYFLLALQSG
jgi:hypothetical protein